MRDVLGYDRFAAGGGDSGAFVSVPARPRVRRRTSIGVHLNFPACRCRWPRSARSARRLRARRSGVAAGTARSGRGATTAHMTVQTEDPQTLAYATQRLARRPRGLDRRAPPQLERLRRRRRAPLHARTTCSRPCRCTGSPRRSTRRCASTPSRWRTAGRSCTTASHRSRSRPRSPCSRGSCSACPAGSWSGRRTSRAGR